MGVQSECAGQSVTTPATETSSSADQRCPSLTYFLAISQVQKNIRHLAQKCKVKFMPLICPLFLTFNFSNANCATVFIYL